MEGQLLQAFQADSAPNAVRTSSRSVRAGSSCVCMRLGLQGRIQILLMVTCGDSRNEIVRRSSNMLQGMWSCILFVPRFVQDLVEDGILCQFVLPPLQLDLHQPNRAFFCVLDDLRGPDLLRRGQLVLCECQLESFDHPFPYFFHEVERDFVLRKANGDLGLYDLTQHIVLGEFALVLALEFYGKEVAGLEALEALVIEEVEGDLIAEFGLAHLEVDMLALFLADDRSLVKLRIILTCLIPRPRCCQFLQGLPLEVELRLHVDYLIDESQVISIEEVAIGLMLGRHWQYLPIEFALDDGPDVIVGPFLAIQLIQLSALELLFETGVVNSMREFEQVIDVLALSAQTAMEGASSQLHLLKFFNVEQVLLLAGLQIAGLSSIEHLEQLQISRKYAQMR